MKQFFLKILFASLLFFNSCFLGGSGSGDFTDTTLLAIDSTNDRLFVVQPRGEIFVYTASTLSKIGDQPVISEDRNASLNAILPFVITKMAVLSSGSTSRIFILGGQDNDSGDFVLNQIRVLDFDGTNFIQASFSPITITDGDDTTDETDDSFSDILADSTNENIFVSDSSTGTLYVYGSTDGAQTTAPLAIGGNPQGLALSDNHLYVCNNSEDDATQVVSVVDVTDFLATTIDIGIPCRLISAASNSNGTVLVAKDSTTQQVLIRLVDTTTYADSTAISSGTSGLIDGILDGGAGLSSAVLGMISTVLSDQIRVYLSEQDGEIAIITFATDLSQYTVETLASTQTGISDSSILTSTSDEALTVFFTARSGAVLSLDVGDTSLNTKN